MAEWEWDLWILVVCDYISGATGSFSTAFGAHTGIGTMPITLYGTEEQKQKIRN
jgi:alkylation response protein AidB-like acyl-CoA dehydrogenase